MSKEPSATTDLSSAAAEQSSKPDLLGDIEKNNEKNAPPTADVADVRAAPEQPGETSSPPPPSSGEKAPLRRPFMAAATPTQEKGEIDTQIKEQDG